MKRLILILISLVTIGLVVAFILSERRAPSAPTNADDADKVERIPQSIDKTGETQGRVGLEHATDSEAIALIEDEIGKLTPEEIELKPDDVSWGDWSYIIGTHRNMRAKNSEVTFYGKVVNFDGSPLSNVSLAAQISYFEPSLAKAIADGDTSGVKKLTLQTDENGGFQISGIEGAKLVLRDFEKDGFELAGKKKGWGYSFVPDSSQRHVGDPSNPQLFTMKALE